MNTARIHSFFFNKRGNLHVSSVSPVASKRLPQVGWGPHTGTPNSAHPSGNSFHQNLGRASDCNTWPVFVHLKVYKTNLDSNTSWTCFSPTLALRNLLPILWSIPMALATSSTSAPVASHRALMLLMLLILCARNALAAYTTTNAKTL